MIRDIRTKSRTVVEWAIESQRVDLVWREVTTLLLPTQRSTDEAKVRRALIGLRAMTPEASYRLVQVTTRSVIEQEVVS